MANLIEEPSPRLTTNIPRIFSWPVDRTLRLAPVVLPVFSGFSEVLEERRSVRAMSRASLRQIINLLAFVARPRFIRDDDRAGRSLRLAPSAGALHCIDTLIVDWRSVGRIVRYNPVAHTGEILRIASVGHIDSFASRVTLMLPDAGQTSIVLIADLARIGAAYTNAESLVWRDAGVLLQTLSLAAVAYRLATCMLGTTGSEILDALALPKEDFAAVGILMIGKHVDVKRLSLE